MAGLDLEGVFQPKRFYGDSVIWFCVLTVEQHMGGGKQHRGPFQGVRVKNSVKELLLHFRSSKQMSSGSAAEESKVTSIFQP